MAARTGTAAASDRTIGRVAVAVGLVVLASAVSLNVYFAVGGPFGTINDVGNGLAGILSALLAWTLRPGASAATRATANAATGAAFLGAALTVVGSALVISDTTGYFLAGLVSSLGFALIGLWLIALNRSLRSGGRSLHRLATFGVVAGVVMAFGLAQAPGIALGVDDMDTAPGWIWIGSIGWTGTYLLYPIWSIWLGRAAARRGD